MSRKSLARLAQVALALTSLAGTGRAQSASGVGDDAIPVVAHGTRIRIGAIWSAYIDKFGPAADGSSGRSPLFSGYARNALGVADLTALAPAQTAIRDLSGLGSAFTLSLGPLEARGDVTKSVVPFQLDYGVSKRLSVSLLVPYVETRSDTRFVLNRGGAGATVGANPARTTGDARTRNGTLLSQIAASRTTLAAEIARCGTATATGGSCDAIRANPTGAQALLTQASTISTQIATVYGTATAAGSPLVPIQKSAVQTAIEARIAALRASFADFASNSMVATSLPVAATTVLASAGLQSIAKDSAYGLAYDSLANGGRAGIGDVDLVATFLLYDGFGASQIRRLLMPKRTLRSTVSAGFRFGTATGGRSDSPFDVPTGDGANALLLRTTTDLIVNRHFWMSGTLRLVKPFDDNVMTRLPGLTDSTLFRPSVQTPAQRHLGQRTEIEIAPRFALGTFYGVSAAYAIAHQGETSFTALAPSTTGITSSVSPATTAQSLLLGASFSTLGAFVRGKSRWPIEAIYTHGITLSGSGGVVPAVTSDRIELRIYTRFPRR